MEFIFDTDVRCSITIYYFCTEESTLNGIKYVIIALSICTIVRLSDQPKFVLSLTNTTTYHVFRYMCKDEKLTSDVYYYKRGANQQFSQNGHSFDPSCYSDEDLFYNSDKDVIPVAIHCVALEGLDGKMPKKQMLERVNLHVRILALSNRIRTSETRVTYSFFFSYRTRFHYRRTSVAYHIRSYRTSLWRFLFSKSIEAEIIRRRFILFTSRNLWNWK